MLGLSSSNDWLDVQSKVDIKEDEVFNNESGYWDALVGVYSLMTGSNLYGGALTMSSLDILACNYDIQYDNFDVGTYNLSMYNYKNTRPGRGSMPFGRICTMPLPTITICCAIWRKPTGVCLTEIITI